MSDQLKCVLVVQRRLGKLQTGADVYLSTVIRNLREEGYSIHLVFAPESSFASRPWAIIGKPFLDLCDSITWKNTLRIRKLYVSGSLQVYKKFIARIHLEILRRLRNSPGMPPLGQIGELLDAEEQINVVSSVNELAPDLIVVEYSSLGPLLAYFIEISVEKAIILHDLFSLRAKAMLSIGRSADFSPLSLEEEATLCESADTLIYASYAECNIFEKIMPNKKHLWLQPNYTQKSLVKKRTQPVAVFIGVKHAGNIDALDFLMEEIWPEVVKRNNKAKLQIIGEIGNCMKPEWRRLPNIEVKGIVDDLTPYVGEHTIGLAPTRVASGVSIKVATYLQYGMTVLATREAMKGYGTTLDHRVTIFYDAKCFAKKLSQKLL
ncbi:MAG: glycosyltransferase family 4 protein [Pseudomonadota bacterium]